MSEKLIKFRSKIVEGIKVWFYLCKGGTHIHLAYVIGTISRIVISVLFIGSLFSPSGRGIIYIDNSKVVLATIVFDLLLMISFGLLIGINRRILIRYNYIKEGKEKILEK